MVKCFSIFHLNCVFSNSSLFVNLQRIVNTFNENWSSFRNGNLETKKRVETIWFFFANITSKSRLKLPIHKINNHWFVSRCEWVPMFFWNYFIWSSIRIWSFHIRLFNDSIQVFVKSVYQIVKKFIWILLCESRELGSYLSDWFFDLPRSSPWITVDPHFFH